MPPSSVTMSKRKGVIFLKKTALLLAIILVLCFPLSVQAVIPEEVQPLALKIYPGLSFEGATAKCSVTVIADNMSDNITVTTKLWKGSSCIATWNSSGKGYVNATYTKIVTLGVRYKLTVDVTINGIAEPTVSIFATS